MLYIGGIHMTNEADRLEEKYICVRNSFIADASKTFAVMYTHVKMNQLKGIYA